MRDIKIQRAEKKDFPYIKEKLKNYILDSNNAKWEDFFVAKNDDKTVAFGRIIDHKEFFEIASLGVDYYHRKKGIGTKLLRFLSQEAKNLGPEKPVYIVTHRPGFAKQAGFKEIEDAPESLEHKKRTKCKLKPAESRVMKLD